MREKQEKIAPLQRRKLPELLRKGMERETFRPFYPLPAPGKGHPLYTCPPGSVTLICPVCEHVPYVESKKGGRERQNLKIGM